MGTGSRRRCLGPAAACSGSGSGSILVPARLLWSSLRFWRRDEMRDEWSMIIFSLCWLVEDESVNGVEVEGVMEL